MEFQKGEKGDGPLLNIIALKLFKYINEYVQYHTTVTVSICSVEAKQRHNLVATPFILFHTTIAPKKGAIFNVTKLLENRLVS